MADTAFILIAHGAREPAWALPLRRVSDAVVAQASDLRVELAFMELMPPNLGECAEKLMAEGYKRILVVPLFIARGGHLMRDIPEELAALHEAHPDVTFELSAPVGESDAVVQAMAAHVLNMARQGNS